MIDLTIQASNIEKSFDRIAVALFEEYKLQIGNTSYQLTEIEFYYNHYDKNKTIDNFAHEHDARYLNGTWRLHGAGLDIVLKSENNYYGGILIRGIQALDADEEPIPDAFIDGPWNTASRCIQQGNQVNELLSFALIRRKKISPRSYKKSPRVGLFLKNEVDLEYICKPWRYTSMPIVTKKYRHLLFLQLWVNNDADLIKQPDLIVKNEKTRQGYMAAFEAGMKMDPAAFIKQKNTVERTCQLFGCYVSQKYPSV